MTMFGISEMSEEDVTNWESVTALYQTAHYYSVNVGVIDLEAQLEVVDTRRRRRLQGDEESMTVVYRQSMTYRLSDTTLDDAFIATDPFSTETQKIG